MSAALQAILDHPGFPQKRAWWREEFGPEQIIVEENDSSRDLFMIESGVVRVNKDIAVTAERHMQSGLLELSNGEIFGELSLFGDVVRNASVVALTAVVLIHVDGVMLAAFLDRHKNLGYRLLKEFFIRHSAELDDCNERYGALYARQLRADGER